MVRTITSTLDNTDVLKFFGVDQSLLTFFEKFFEAPLRFVQDGPDGLVQPRKYGISMSHALSNVFGESVLFCLDYAVNQATSGAVLCRLHDGFWFWGQEDECCKAWTAITSFAEVAGLKMNPEKTGTARTSADNPRPPGHFQRIFPSLRFTLDFLP